MYEHYYMERKEDKVEKKYDFNEVDSYGEESAYRPYKKENTRPNVSHYKQGGIEPIKFINSHNLNFNLGNVVKYIVRSPYKGSQLEDLKKARDYINFEIERIQNES